MTMVIDLGLERFFYGEPDEARVAAAHALVEQDLTTLVREVVAPEGGGLDQARVFEARRERDGVVGRWLEPDQAKPVLDAVRALYAKHDSFVSFSWDEIDRFGIEGPRLVFVNDGGNRAAPCGTRINLPGIECRVQIGDIWSLWLGSREAPKITMARAFLDFAQQHRLIVHGA